ncbi:MAG: ABC transporter permease [Candidatus Heimdallarchaeota archaeon]
MSVFDKSYRRYKGELKGRWFKIWSIATTTFRVQFSGKKIIFLLILCNIPMIAFTLMLVFTAIFFPQGLTEMLFGMFGTLDVAMYTVINFTFNAGLIFLPIVFISALNSGTIANDKKHNSLALYMAKPIDRIDYVLGKTISVYMISSFVTLIPWLMFLILFTLLAGSTQIQFLDTLWVYLSTSGSALVVILFLGSIVLLFSSFSNQSVLAGILTIMILFLPDILVTTISGILDISWINYLSISTLLTAAIFLIFGKPDFEGLLGSFYEANINGWISIVILLAIAIICVLFTINNLYKEEID